MKKREKGVNRERAASPSLQPRKAQKKVPTPILHHLSCLEGMANLPSSSTRLVLADPPYGIGVSGGATWDCMQGSDYMDFARAWLKEAVRILMPGGTLLFFASPCKLWVSRMNLILNDELEMNHIQTLAWVYSQGTHTFMLQLVYTHTHIFFFACLRWRRAPGKHEVVRRASRGRRVVG